jgi:WD40 repeat protein
MLEFCYSISAILNTQYLPQVSSVALSEDGQWVVSTSQDESIMLWSATDGKKLAKFHAHYPALKLHLVKSKSKIVGQLASPKPLMTILKLLNLQ